MLRFEDLSMRVLSEKFYTYRMPEDKQLTMYDFYVLDYLKYILDRPSHNYRDLPTDLIDSVNNAVNNLYPALREELLHAVLYAVCAEIRYAEDSGRKETNRNLVKQNPKFEKLYKLWLKYQNFHQKSLKDRDELTDIYDVRKPSAKKRTPTTEKNNNEARNLSYKGAQYAIEKSGLLTADFVEMCEYLYNEGAWTSLYGGKAWGNICTGWLDLYKAEKIDPNVKGADKGMKGQNKKPMSVAIDHIYDLQHNTNTVFNKLESYYKNGYWWIKEALDDKANTLSYHKLLNKASGTVKAMALPVLYNKLGQTWEKEMGLEKPVDNYPQTTPSNDLVSAPNYKIGDYVTYNINGSTKQILDIDTANSEMLLKGKPDDKWVKFADVSPSANNLVAGSEDDPYAKNPEKNSYLYKKGDKVKFFDIGDGAYSDFEHGEIYEVSEDATDPEYLSVYNSSKAARTMFTTRVELVVDNNKPNSDKNINTDFNVGDTLVNKEGTKLVVKSIDYSLGKFKYDVWKNGVIYSHDLDYPIDYIKQGLENGVWKVDNDQYPTKPITDNKKFKAGDKVKCVDATYSFAHLTEGKIYEVVGISQGLGDMIKIIDDIHEIKSVGADRFEHVTTTNTASIKPKREFKVGDKVVSNDDQSIGVINFYDSNKLFPYYVKWSDNSFDWHKPEGLSKPKPKTTAIEPKFKVGDYVIAKGFTDSYPGQIIKYDKMYDMYPYLVKFEDSSIGDEWLSADKLSLDDQI